MGAGLDAPVRHAATSAPKIGDAPGKTTQPAPAKNRIAQQMDRIREREAAAAKQAAAKQAAAIQSKAAAPRPTAPKPTAPGPTAPKPAEAIAANDSNPDSQDPDSRDPADVDGAIKAFMTDPRYLDPAKRQKAFADGIAKLWQAAYPDPYKPGSFGRDAIPRLSVGDIHGMAERIGLIDTTVPGRPEVRLLPGQPERGRTAFDPPKSKPTPLGGDEDASALGRPHVRLMRDPDDPRWRALGLDRVDWRRTPLRDRLDLEDALATPQGRAALRRQALGEIDDLDPDSAVQLRAALDAALPEEPGTADDTTPGQRPGDVQTAFLPNVLRMILGRLGGKGGRRDDSEPPYPMPKFPPQEPAKPPPDRTESPHEPPAPDAPGGRPDQSDIDDRPTPAYPDGTGKPDADSPPPSPDQSDELPQGTILPTQKPREIPGVEDFFGGNKKQRARGKKALDAMQQEIDERGDDLRKKYPNTKPDNAVPKSESPVWKNLDSSGGNDDSKRSFDGKFGFSYDKGSDGHGAEIEVFDRRTKKHLGTIDPITGEVQKGPVRNRPWKQGNVDAPSAPAARKA